MKHTGMIIGFLILVGCLALIGNALATDGFMIGRSVVSGGGQEATGGDFILLSTIGEPIASGVNMGTTHGFSSGFWWLSRFWLYLPLVLTN